MADSENSALLQLLPKFSPFDLINESLLHTLANSIDIRSAKKSFVLFEKGDYDSDEYYLISGKVLQQAYDGRENIIEAGQASSRYPIARLRPRMYTATAACDIRYFVVSASVLDELQRSIRVDNSDLMAHEKQQNSGDHGYALIYEFKQELKSGRFVLPSLPEVAYKIRELIDSSDFTMADLAKLVNSDVAIATKLVKVANSPVYRGVNQCDDTLKAISRLGIVTTKQLVTSFAVLAMYKSESNKFKNLMTNLWKESVEVAAYCYVLAKQLEGFNEEQALLAGLIHSIGEIVVLTYAERFYDLSEDKLILDETIAILRGPIGELVLREWGFTDELINVASEWNLWERKSIHGFDYCDLVQIAMLYAQQNNSDFLLSIEIHEEPVLNKLKKLQLSPEQIETMVIQAEEQIAEIRSIFS